MCRSSAIGTESSTEPPITPGWVFPAASFRRASDSFAGDAALLIVPLYNAVRLRTVLLTIHIGEANLALPNSKGIFLIYAIFSVIGWIFVGVPIVIALPERLLSRVPWLGCTFIGATLGPLALLIILLVLFEYQGRPSDSVSPTPKASGPSLS